MTKFHLNGLRQLPVRYLSVLVALCLCAVAAYYGACGGSFLKNARLQKSPSDAMVGEPSIGVAPVASSKDLARKPNPESPAQKSDTKSTFAKSKIFRRPTTQGFSKAKRKQIATLRAKRKARILPTRERLLAWNAPTRNSVTGDFVETPKEMVVADAWETRTQEHEGAIDVVSPLQEIAAIAFSESPQGSEETGLELPRTSAELSAGERRIGVVVGEIEQNEFAEIRAQLQEQLETFPQVQALWELPEMQSKFQVAQAVRPEAEGERSDEVVQAKEKTTPGEVPEEIANAGEPLALPLAQETASSLEKTGETESSGAKVTELKTALLGATAEKENNSLTETTALEKPSEEEASTPERVQVSEPQQLSHPATATLPHEDVTQNSREISPQELKPFPMAPEAVTTQKIEPIAKVALDTHETQKEEERALVEPSVAEETDQLFESSQNEKLSKRAAASHDESRTPDASLTPELVAGPESGSSNPKVVSSSDEDIAPSDEKHRELQLVIPPKRQVNLGTSVMASVAPSIFQPQASVSVKPVAEKAVSEKEKNVLVIPDKPQDPTTVVARRVRVVPPPQLQDASHENEGVSPHALDQKIYGTLELDDSVVAWLEENNGHVELALHPVKSRDGQDKIQLDYEFPSSEFVVEPRGLKGNYHLVASFFTADHSHEAAQITHSRVISHDNHTQKVRFRINEKSFFDATSDRASASSASGVRFTSVVYEVNPDNPEKLQAVAGGKLSVVGFPQWGVGEVQKDGSLRMKLPSQSQVVAYVSAPGYYPTYQVIPTFSQDVHSHIYLIPSPTKDRFTAMDAIIRAFTGQPQNPAFGLIMGRVFDPESRRPIAKEVVALSNPQAALAMLPKTSASGFYGFTNVVPSMRAIQRPNGGRVALVSAMPGSAQYVDLGRGGKRSVNGMLTDPFGGENIPVSGASVQLVADEKSKTETDETGSFRVENVDLPPGVLTFEVKAEGYPVTWHNVPWNVAERPKTLSLRMIPEHWLESSREANRIPRPNPGQRAGSLVGGVSKAIFQNRDVCLSVQLMTVLGQVVSGSHGPFPFSGPSANRQKSLCLTPQNPGFVFFDLPDGEYILKYLTPNQRLIKTRVLRVGKGRVTVTVE